MKKLLLSSGFVFGIMCLTSTSVLSIPIYEAPNAGNLNFYPMMQYQMEKQEMLDFTNDPEHYKENREKKNNQGKLKKSNFNPKYSPENGSAFHNHIKPVQMQFTKDADGNIKIKSVE